jgi:hypothetical protein
MLRAGFEPTIPALERKKTVHAFDRAATVISRFENYQLNFYKIRGLGYIASGSACALHHCTSASALGQTLIGLDWVD